MNPISLDIIDNQFIIRIDKEQINKERLLQFVDSLRIETLAEQVDFSEDIEKLGKEIKTNWWKANKDKYIPKENQ